MDPFEMARNLEVAAREVCLMGSSMQQAAMAAEVFAEKLKPLCEQAVRRSLELMAAFAQAVCYEEPLFDYSDWRT